MDRFRRRGPLVSSSFALHYPNLPSYPDYLLLGVLCLPGLLPVGLPTCVYRSGRPRRDPQFYRLSAVSATRIRSLGLKVTFRSARHLQAISRILLGIRDLSRRYG